MKGKGRRAGTQPVVRMKKRRSPHTVIIETDPADNHFMNVTVQKSKTGAVVATHYILRSDLDQWVGMFKKDGYTHCE